MKIENAKKVKRLLDELKEITDFLDTDFGVTDFLDTEFGVNDTVIRFYYPQYSTIEGFGVKKCTALFGHLITALENRKSEIETELEEL